MKEILQTPEGFNYFKDEKFVISQVKNEYKEIKFLKDDVVIDMGANIGAFSFNADKIVKQIIAVEPNIIAFKLLNMNLNGNSIKYNKAIVQQNGPSTIDLYYTNNTVITRNSKLRHSNKTTIKTISIDKLMAYNPTILKIDIEGAEYEWIQDIIFPKSVKQIAVELHSTRKYMYEKRDEAIKNILSQGFKTISEHIIKLYGRIGAITYVFKRN